MTSPRQHRERRPARAATRGQAMMEFAVVAVLFATLLGGVLEFGRVWSAANVLNAAARDGARLGAVTTTNRTNVVKARVEQVAATYFAAQDLTVSTTGGKGASGEPILTVTATGKLEMLFGNWLLGKTVKLSRSTTMRDETVAN